MTNLPVREMVLYKHGVGFFVRGGNVSGDLIALNFRADEINDVLKSLAVFDQTEGGQVYGVHYQTPMDRQHRLATSSIQLTQQGTLIELLQDLRGRQVTMRFETMPGRIDTVRGRLVGVDVRVDSYEQRRVTLLSTEGGVHVFKINDLRSFDIEDSQSEQDLTYFLDTSMTEDDRRTINIRLSEGDHDLLVSYVTPSPTWRVSYRVVAESADGGSTGKALLQGWGLFDNRLEEDLENVQVTLVAGQPISFIYDLYTSKIPKRQTVRDEARIMGPVEFQEASKFPMTAEAAPSRLGDVEDVAEERVTRGSRKGVFGAFAAPPPFARAMRREAAAQSAQPDAEGKATGETFQYVVKTPVSVKRGESALVPIIGAEVEYERELLYNKQKLDQHPVAALRFKNTTGLTLERGPVTLVEDTDYKGEAIIAFTKEDSEVYLPYAVELGVRVRESHDSRFEHHALHIEETLLIEEQHFIRSTAYHIENTTDDAKTITVEQAIPDNEDLYDTPAPVGETLSEKRWHVAVAAREKAEFTVSTRKLTQKHHQLHDLQYQQVQRWAEKRHLDQETFEELSELVKTVQFISKTRDKIQQAQDERSGIYQQQEQLRANLGALQSTGKEAELRDRILRQLTGTQNRLEEIEREVAASERAIEEAERRIETLIKALNAGD